MSKRGKKWGLLVLGVVLIGVVGFGWYWIMAQRRSAILVETVPEAQVYVDGEYVGRTPYEGEFKKTEVALKLVPESYEAPMAPYETRVALMPGVKTVIRRVFGQREEDSYGEEISFEKLGGDSVSSAVISDPDGAKVIWDGKILDITPLRLDDVTVGVHQLTIRANGYEDRSFSVQVVRGYGVTVNVKLRKVGEAGSDDVEGLATVDEEEKGTLFVKILATPVGFLRVRQEASTDSSEIGRVSPDEKYEVLEKNEENGWYKIKMADDQKSGWISGEYAEEVEEEG